MKFSENWLRELVSIDADRDTLSHALTMAGLEVEELTVLGASLDGVVVGEIIEALPHPEADRLQICKVAIGPSESLQIVCGAPNARVGLKAPLATVGAQLGPDFKIRPAKLRGVESFGMLCSAKELGLDEDASGLFELPVDAPVGQALSEYLQLPDACFELKLTPNRSDCLGLYGLAHDVAALFGSEVRQPGTEAVAPVSAARRGIRLEAGKDAPRYLGRVIEDIDAAAATPLWMAERLRRSGLRSISAVVDVTNYVMLELGQPMHAYDNAKLQGDVVVRYGIDGEPLKLLNGAEAKLGSPFLVVADQAGPLAVGGIIGGEASKVTDGTRQIFLEAAHFVPSAIMGRARRLGLHTDASHRFERGVDPWLPDRAIERATELLLQIVGGRAGPVVSCQIEQGPARPQPIVLRRARLARVLGIQVADHEVARIFASLGMKVEPQAQGWTITAPSSRFDIEREEDLIEEVARIYGYDRIPTHAPGGQLQLAVEPEARIGELALREQWAARGYFEAVNLAFVSADLLQRWGLERPWVELANPLSAELGVMRPSLLPGLIEALRHNQARQQPRVRLFELGRVFATPAAVGDAPQETPSFAAVISGSAAGEQWGVASRAVDFYDLKGDLDATLNWGGETSRWSLQTTDLPTYLHPGRAASLLYQGAVVGYIGALHPQLSQALDLTGEVYVLEVTLAALTGRRLPQARPIPRYPSVRRDLALDFPEETPWSEVDALLREKLGERLVELRLFDCYRGKGVEAGRKSLAMGLILQDASRTLTDDDADHSVREAVAALEYTCKAKWRG
ncbi:phenylalanine--tRNA ligase subunit beta [Frateuria aurantia]